MENKIISKQLAKALAKRITTEYHSKHLNTNKLEGETVDDQVGGGRTNFILRARKSFRSLNL
jgi:hypothetical protein